MRRGEAPHLLLVGQLLVLLGQDLGQVQVAHLRVDFGVFGSFLHEEAKVRSQRFFGEIWMSLFEHKVKGQMKSTVFYTIFLSEESDSPSAFFLCTDS